jgi:hypothetical protein
MKNKYTFSFKEISFGSIVIESENAPSELEVTEAIMNGGAYIDDSYYENIRLESQEKVAPKRDRGYER